MPPAFRVLHAIHDYLPRHQAGSEIYVAALTGALARAGHHPAVVAAEFDPSRAHGALAWRSHAGIPVVELANTWQFGSFQETYSSPALTAALGHVLDAVQPHVLHVHNLLDLSMELPALARTRGIRVVATLHDYTLVCATGGQRIHRAEAHLCREIDPERCARCFQDSPYHAQWHYGKLARLAPRGVLGSIVSVVRGAAPRLAGAARAALRHAPSSVGQADIAGRLDAARRAFGCFDLAVAPSPSLGAEYARLGFPADRIVVSDYGFPPLQGAPPAPAAERPSGGPLRVGFVGTLVWHKGPDLLIEAARRLPAGAVDVRIFGDTAVFPDYARTLEAAAAGLPIRFMGPFDHDRAAEAFSQIDVLAVPSRWLENSPLVIHEAFMAGVPVVGAEIGGIADLLADGRGGLLVPPDDAGALAEALQALASAPQRLEALRRDTPAVKSIEEDAREWIARYADVTARAPRALPTAS